MNPREGAFEATQARKGVGEFNLIDGASSHASVMRPVRVWMGASNLK